MSIEKLVHKKHLSNDIDEIQKFTDDELSSVEVVSADVPEDVSHHHVSLVLNGLSVRVEGAGWKVLE